MTPLSMAIDGAHSSVAPAGMSTLIIAVDGQGGAGKSTFAEHLALGLGGVQIVHTDDFASSDNPIDWWPELRDRVLLPVAAGHSAAYLPTRWGGEVRSQIVIQPTEFLVLEGVSASRHAFQPYLAYAIWIGTPRELRLQRGLERDGEEARDLWEEWMAAEDLYVAKECPAERADLIIRGDQETGC